MGPKFGGGVKCGRCDKYVYAAEEVKAIRQSWHKMCFRCITCNKMLDSTNCTDKDDKIYCKTCYAKAFGPKGYGVGQGAGILQMYNSPVGAGEDVARENVPPVDAHEPSKSDFVEGEAIAAENPIDIEPASVSTTRLSNGSGSLTSLNRSSSNGGLATSAPVDRDLCARCQKRVYFAEKTTGAGRTWHKSCFRCTTCSKNLDSFASEKDGNIFCKACYAKNFGPKGFGVSGALQYTE